MVRRALKSVVALLPVWVAVTYCALTSVPAPAAQVFQTFLSAGEVEPLEEDETPAEDPFESESIPPRVRSRDDIRSLLDGGLAQHVRVFSSPHRGCDSRLHAGAALELTGRNGRRAILRC